AARPLECLFRRGTHGQVDQGHQQDEQAQGQPRRQPAAQLAQGEDEQSHCQLPGAAWIWLAVLAGGAAAVSSRKSDSRSLPLSRPEAKMPAEASVRLTS